MSDNITIYYYTAWDGFAWQGCDEATAKSLQGYMEATGTLPQSSADEPPFGGAVACKIAGRLGVAVYRYLTREKGDVSGRDSLYIAFAFVPLDAGSVDFEKLLKLPQLSTPKPGELCPEEVSVDGRGLRLETSDGGPDGWLDCAIAGTEFHVLRGGGGLRRLSALFFSKYTQLGFLNSVFTKDARSGELVATQTYSVYPEVTDVVEASTEFSAERAKARARGQVIDRNSNAVVRMEASLGRLLERWKRFRGYEGLKDYHDEKMAELSDDKERLEIIKDYNREILEACGSLQGDVELSVVERSMELADKMATPSIPILDCEYYRKALRLSLAVMKSAANCKGRFEELETVRIAEEAKVKAEKAQAMAEKDLSDVKKELKDFEHNNTELKNQNETLTRLNKQLTSQNETLTSKNKQLTRENAELRDAVNVKPLESSQNTYNAYHAGQRVGNSLSGKNLHFPVTPPPPKKRSLGFADWILIVLSIVLVCMIAFLGYFVWQRYSNHGTHTKSDETNQTQSAVEQQDAATPIN